jgi:hypothetical protein
VVEKKVIETKKNTVKKVTATVKPKVAAATRGSKSPVRKSPSKKSSTSPIKAAKKIMVTPEERYRMVQTAAYYIAERNGFRGDSIMYWAAAEAEISARLAK